MTEADFVSFGKAERRQQSLHRALAGIVKTNERKRQTDLAHDVERQGGVIPHMQMKYAVYEQAE